LHVDNARRTALLPDDDAHLSKKKCLNACTLSLAAALLQRI